MYFLLWRESKIHFQKNQASLQRKRYFFKAGWTSKNHPHFASQILDPKHPKIGTPGHFLNTFFTKKVPKTHDFIRGTIQIQLAWQRGKSLQSTIGIFEAQFIQNVANRPVSLETYLVTLLLLYCKQLGSTLTCICILYPIITWNLKLVPSLNSHCLWAVSFNQAFQVQRTKTKP